MDPKTYICTNNVIDIKKEIERHLSEDLSLKTKKNIRTRLFKRSIHDHLENISRYNFSDKKYKNTAINNKLDELKRKDGILLKQIKLEIDKRIKFSRRHVSRKFFVSQFHKYGLYSSLEQRDHSLYVAFKESGKICPQKLEEIKKFLSPRPNLSDLATRFNLKLDVTFSGNGHMRRQTYNKTGITTVPLGECNGHFYIYDDVVIEIPGIMNINNSYNLFHFIDKNYKHVLI